MNAKTTETRAVGEAGHLAGEARAARDDVSFLSREAQRLDAELRLVGEENHRLRDQLARCELALEDQSRVSAGADGSLVEELRASEFAREQ